MRVSVVLKSGFISMGGNYKETFLSSFLQQLVLGGLSSGLPLLEVKRRDWRESQEAQRFCLGLLTGIPDQQVGPRSFPYELRQHPGPEGILGGLQAGGKGLGN